MRERFRRLRKEEEYNVVVQNPWRQDMAVQKWDDHRNREKRDLRVSTAFGSTAWKDDQDDHDPISIASELESS